MNTIGFMATKTVEGSSRSGPRQTNYYRGFIETVEFKIW
uniref:Uncharacterized protein n=1 Tax=Vitis vinifera TaxID=29760 RepID=F6H892_VITVI